MLNYFLWQFNKNNKPADRAIVITDKLIYKLDPKKKYKAMKKGIPISMVINIKVISICMVSNYLKETQYINRNRQRRDKYSNGKNNTKESV